MDDYFCEPIPPNEELYQRLKAYYDDCEAYDRTVCTGPVIHGEIQPLTHTELHLINRYANQRWRQLRTETASYSEEEFQRAKRSFNR